MDFNVAKEFKERELLGDFKVQSCGILVRPALSFSGTSEAFKAFVLKDTLEVFQGISGV